MPQSNAPAGPGGPGSARARLRLVAVVLLALLAMVWLLISLRLYFAPPAGLQASAAALLAVPGALVATAYVGCARWVAKQVRWGHLVAIGVVGLALLFGISVSMSWVDWAVLGANLVTLAMLLGSVPRR